MSESSMPERPLAAVGFVQAPFWADLVASATGQSDLEVPVPRRGTEAPGADAAIPQRYGEAVPDGPGVQDVLPEAVDETDRDEDELDPDGEGDRDTDAAGERASDPGDDEASAEEGEGGAGTDQAADEDAEEDAEEDADGDTDGDPDEDAAEPEPPTRYDELVAEHVRRARYTHHLTRPIFTPEESIAVVLVERRAAVWVPTMTFVATVVSAVAAVVLATRLRSDPSDPSSNQVFIVTVTVCLLAAAIATLIRAEVHYDRLRPRGRVVRHDVADAYDLVRDAPRRLVRLGAPIDVLRRVADLLPAAERLVDALATYTLRGGTQVRAHPAYERIIRMRAEVEALEVLLKEQREREAAEQEGRPEKPVRREPPQLTGAPEPLTGTTPRLPRPDQVPDYTGLADLAAPLIVPEAD